MKKLLFVLDSLSIGGAEKSLVSLLNSIDYSRFEIDLLLFKRGGDLEELLPKEINYVPTPDYFRYLNKEYFSFKENLKFLGCRLKTSIDLRKNTLSKVVLHSEQIVYKNIKKIISTIDNTYDVAIGYSQGMPTYFVANHVKAMRKLAWINTDYVNTLYNKEIDYQSYKKIDKIITVSKNTQQTVANLKKDYQDKTDILLDIVNPDIINRLAEENQPLEYLNNNINILTVGRLETAKSYDTAIEVAKLLRDSGYKFKWFCIGEGSERQRLEGLISQYNLNNNFILLGKKLNPYSYMKCCTLYVQTSKKEGFGLTVCEAKILKKPIVCTNFPTAKEIIDHDIDGLIVHNSVDDIFQGIKRYLDDVEYLKRITNQLNERETYSSINQLEKFYTLLEL
ncbi:glycosyltransferase [Robertmurraya beringensis]|uniref:Glycosyltransferase n=1 Tax=Robertmurraya beringensis TaxID=641660 RepID=A0ABV6KW67_9BACI